MRGIRNKKKRIKIFNYLKERLKNGLILLQETHSTNEDLENWSNELNCKLLLNSHTSIKSPSETGKNFKIRKLLMNIKDLIMGE